MKVGLLSLHLHLPGCASLKEKRSKLKPMMHRVHLKFNVSISEAGYQDKWTESLIYLSSTSNDAKFTQAELNKIIYFIKYYFRDFEIVEHSIEIF